MALLYSVCWQQLIGDVCLVLHSSKAQAGTRQLQVDAMSSAWRKVSQLLLSTAVNITTHHFSEIVAVQGIDEVTGQVTLSDDLLSSYEPGSIVRCLSRSIRVTSEQYRDGGGRLKIIPPNVCGFLVTITFFLYCSVLYSRELSH